MTERHPRFFHLGNLALITPLCVLGSIIGMQLLIRLGVTTNTALIGALAGMGLGRVPVRGLRFYRSIHVQNLAQSAISASTFGAANALLLPIGIPFLLGRADLVPVMFAGAAAAMLLDATLLYRMFGSEVFPATGPWPPGVAAAEAIRAGDQGGRKAAVLGLGLALGLGGSILGIPMSGFGVAFIGNVWALTMFGTGLLARGYSHLLFGHLLFGHLLWGHPAFAAMVPGGDLGRSHIPQGMMLGAGLAALLQVGLIVLRRPRRDSGQAAAEVSPAALRRTIGAGFGLYLLIATGIALAGGLLADLSPARFVGFVCYAALAALLHELIIGLAGMHSGWFPAFAVAVVSLAVGLLIGFPAPALALLVGFTASTGPAFADMGCDLKAGYMLRGDGKDPAFEADGRRQQLYAALYALGIAAVTVLVAYPGYFARGEVAPVDHVFVEAIRAGSSPELAHDLMLWAVPGAVLQLLGGSRRQLGVLFATGLLLHAPAAGWAVLAGIACRTAWLRYAGERGRAPMEVFAAGTIAADALFSFAGSMLRR